MQGESEYKKALASIMQSYKELQSELKLVTSQFDKNDKSQDALKAKTEAMTKLLDQQRAKLDLLNERYKELVDLSDRQKQNIQSLNEKYKAEVSTLEQLERSVGKTSAEYKAQETVVRNLENELDREQKANEQTEKTMSQLRVEMNNTQTEANKTSREIDNLGNETEEAGIDAEKAANGGFTILKGVIANLASEAISKAVEGVKNLASKLVDVGKQSYNTYAEYEQLVGGVETLYGESADRLQKYAMDAYKTSGVSANKYMEQATSFAATLLQGLDGDTEKAVDYADLAIRDMADNANKMGTNISMIQNAYQGFAKDNYTMLDNLKLGYGGTAAEMARLVNEMKVLGLNEDGELIKVDAQTVKNVGMDKIIEAIHLVQQQLGITGTTAKEAEGTITGSMGQMAAAFENLKVAFATGNGEEVRGWVETLTQSVEIMLKNAIPRIKNIVKGMWTGIKKTLRDNVPGVANELIPFIEKIKNTFTGLFNFIKENGSTIIAVLKGVVAAFVALKAAAMLQNVISGISAFFAAMNPATALIGTLAALVGVMAAVETKTTEAAREAEVWRASVEETSDKINEQVSAWENLKTAQENYITEENSKLGYYESLWEELKKITDENGKIKEGYEERAKYIAEKLGADYGVEIEIVGGVIQKYKELQETMTNVMAQKRANVVLTAQQQLFESAVGGQDELLETLQTRKNELEEAEKKLKQLQTKAENAQEKRPKETATQYAARQVANQMAIDEASAYYEAKKAEYKQAQGMLAENLYYIKQYEENYAAMQEGNYNKIITNNQKYIKDAADLDEAEKQQIKDSYERKKLLRDIEYKELKRTGDERYKTMVEQTDNEIDELARRLDALGVYVQNAKELYGEIAGFSAIQLPSVNVPFSGNILGGAIGTIANAIQAALNGTKVEMDGEEMGRVITGTITRQVYSQNYAQ